MGFGVAAVHGPCTVSNWKYRASGVGAVGANVLATLNEKLGVWDVVMFPARGVIVVVSGIACTCSSVMTVTAVSYTHLDVYKRQ